MIHSSAPSALDIARDQLSMMAELVHRAFTASLKAFFESDVALAYKVINGDKAINSYEIDIDNTTFNILAMNQLTEEQLRTVLSIQRINATLERISDHAVNIAESAISLASWGQHRELLELPEMAESCMAIFTDAIRSFKEKDTLSACEIIGRDDEVDVFNISITSAIKTKIMCGEFGEMSLERGMELIRISKNLERIADLSTNIAEETSFAVLGINLKHHAEEIVKSMDPAESQKKDMVKTVC